jgi:hypothetical protein
VNGVTRLPAWLGRESPGQTIQATALVYETLAEIGRCCATCVAESHLLLCRGCGGNATYLAERGRRRLAIKRGGGIEPLNVDEIEIPSPTPNDDKLLRIGEAVEKLSAAFLCLSKSESIPANQSRQGSLRGLRRNLEALAGRD